MSPTTASSLLPLPAITYTLPSANSSKPEIQSRLCILLKNHSESFNYFKRALALFKKTDEDGSRKAKTHYKIALPGQALALLLSHLNPADAARLRLSRTLQVFVPTVSQETTHLTTVDQAFSVFRMHCHPRYHFHFSRAISSIPSKQHRPLFGCPMYEWARKYKS